MLWNGWYFHSLKSEDLCIGWCILYWNWEFAEESNEEDAENPRWRRCSRHKIVPINKSALLYLPDELKLPTFLLSFSLQIESHRGLVKPLIPIFQWFHWIQWEKYFKLKTCNLFCRATIMQSQQGTGNLDRIFILPPVHPI